MKIKKMEIKEYLKELSSKNATPGGGSVAGITAAQGVALNLMVINITLNNKKYEEFFQYNEEIKKNCEKIYLLLENGADNDKDAFSKLSEAYGMPKETEDEKNNKTIALDKASLGAIEVPLEVIKLSLDGLKLTEKLIGKSSKMAISDLGVAASMFRSASESAWLNVKINLPYLKDRQMAEKFHKEGIELLDEIKVLSNYIYEKVEGEI